MTAIDTQFSGAQDAFEKASRGYGFGVGAGSRSSSTTPSPSSEATPEASPHDAVQDTVSLSAGGQKIVNLNRSQELAQQLKNAPIDKDFAETLKQSSADVLRITQLFTETIKSAFSWLR